MHDVSRRKFGTLALGGIVAGATALATPFAANAQFSSTYRFFQGVRDRDFEAVQTAMQAPGSTVINARDSESGDAALHIITRRRDTQWLLHFLRERANPNIRNRDGDTAMHIAAQIGYPEAIRWLNVVEADVNATNNRGETPLVLAVQQRNATIVRQLIDAGANPDIADSVVGMSANDYAARDSRSSAIRDILSSAESATQTLEAVGPVLD